jgi:hypothetical protein
MGQGLNTLYTQYYFVVMTPDGQVWNNSTLAFEAVNMSNWTDYAIIFPTTLIPGGVYPSQITGVLTTELVFTNENYPGPPSFVTDYASLAPGVYHSQGFVTPPAAAAASLPSQLVLQLQPAGPTPGTFQNNLSTPGLYAQQEDVGVQIVVQFVEADETPIDVSAASSKRIDVQYPSGVLRQLTAAFLTDGSDGQIYVTTAAPVSTTGNVTINLFTITGLSSTTGLWVGQDVSGVNIPADSKIVSVDSSTQVTFGNVSGLGAVATATATPVVFGGTLDEIGEYVVQGRVVVGSVTQATQSGNFQVNASF